MPPKRKLNCIIAAHEKRDGTYLQMRFSNRGMSEICDELVPYPYHGDCVCFFLEDSEKPFERMIYQAHTDKWVYSSWYAKAPLLSAAEAKRNLEEAQAIANRQRQEIWEALSRIHPDDAK